MITDDDSDFIARTRAKWRQAMPELDTFPMELLGRINRISAQSIAQQDRVLSPSGVSRSEFDVLCALVRSQRPLRASEVTSLTMLSGAATTKLTARLESVGFIERRRSDRDGRVVMLEVTEDGKQLVREQMPHCLDQDRQALRGLTEEELSVLSGLLRKVAANADAAAYE